MKKLMENGITSPNYGFTAEKENLDKEKYGKENHELLKRERYGNSLVDIVTVKTDDGEGWFYALGNHRLTEISDDFNDINMGVVATDLGFMCNLILAIFEVTRGIKEVADL